MSENTATESVTGNPTRDAILSNAILKLYNNGDDPSLLPSVQIELPHDFDLDAAELQAMLDHMGIKPPVVEAPVKAPVEGEQPTEPPPEIPEHSRDHVLDSIVQLNREIVQAQADLISLGHAQRYARDVLAKAIQAFAAGSFVQPTREQCVREVGETMKAVREGRVPSAPRPVRAQGSVIDRMNGLDGGPGAADRFARKQMERGYRRSTRGDVYGRLSDGPNGQPRYGIRPKLPSEL